MPLQLMHAKQQAVEFIFEGNLGYWILPVLSHLYMSEMQATFFFAPLDHIESNKF